MVEGMGSLPALHPVQRTLESEVTLPDPEEQGETSESLMPHNPPDSSEHQKIGEIAVFCFLDTASLSIPFQLSETYQVTDPGEQPHC